MKKVSITESVLKNSFWSFLVVSISRIGGLIFGILIARYLLPEKLGIYVIAISMALFLVSLFSTAVNNTSSRYISDSVNKKYFKEASRYYRLIFNINLYLSLVLGLTLIILSYPLSFYIYKKPETFLPLIFSSIFLICLFFQNFYESIFYSLKKVKYLTFKEAIFQILKLSLLGLLFIFPLNLNRVILIISIFIISSIVTIFYLRTQIKVQAPFLFIKENFYQGIFQDKIVLAFFKKVILSNISLTLLSYIDVFIIGIFLSAEYSGYYSAAFSLIGGLYASLSSANLLLPFFTEVKKERISWGFNQVFKYTSMISIPAIFGIFVLGKYFLRTIYGYDFILANVPLLILSLLVFEIPTIFNLISLFYSKDKPDKVLRAVFKSMVLNLVLNLLVVLIFLRFSQYLALAGIAGIVVISRTYLLAEIILLAKKELGLDISFSSFFKSIFSSAIMALFLFFINYLNLFGELNLSIGIIEVALGIIIYFIFLYLFKGIGKEDIRLIKMLLNFKKTDNYENSNT